MGLKCGIVGLPNVGKSTLFNALTGAKIAAANFPFCTIDPNTDQVKVPDIRLDKLAEIVKPERMLPAVATFVDIAGLVAGASKGEGRGNQFLSHIRETDAIIQVVRCFEDDQVIHVSDRINPLDDVEVINLELVLADLESLEKSYQRLERQAKIGDKEAKLRAPVLKDAIAWLSDARPLRLMSLEPEALKILSQYQCLTLKPMLYLANISEEDAVSGEIPDLAKPVAQLAEKEGTLFMVMCNHFEAELMDMSPEDRSMFLESIGQTESGLDRFIRAGFHLLQLRTYFTAGEKEVRAWTISEGMLAPQAAGVIHSDFERGFIAAEVIAYEDFIAHKGTQGAREAGKARIEGKGYEVCDGDVVHFRFNV